MEYPSARLQIMHNHMVGPVAWAVSPFYSILLDLNAYFLQFSDGSLRFKLFPGSSSLKTYGARVAGSLKKKTVENPFFKKMLVQLFQINIYFLFSYGPTPRDTNLKRIKHKKGWYNKF